jgi:hypothetical protein
MTRRRVVLGGLALGATLALALALVLWLGPRDLAWSARSLAAPADPAASLALVPATLPILVVADPARALASPVALAVRADLDLLAREHGVDLDLVQRHVARTVTGADGHALVATIGTGAMPSPLLLARFDRRWHRATIGDHAAVDDGALVLVPLAPGQVLAVPHSVAAEALALATTPRGIDEGAGSRVGVIDAGDVLAADLRLDPSLRAGIGANFPPEAQAVLADLVRVRFTATPGERLHLVARLEHATEEGARAAQQILYQLDSYARLARRAGALSSLLGDAGAIARDVPDVAVTRDGLTVRLQSDVSPELLRRWIRRGLAQEEAE